jgi:trk/ktr system potassium uptake protein
MRVLVIGFGAFGSWVARTLKGMGHEVVVIERDAELVDRQSQWATRAVVGDATDPVLLERVGARGVDVAVIGTAQDLSTTILAMIALRDLGVEEIYAKVASETEARALAGLDVSDTIFPEHEAGFRLAHRIASKTVLDYTPIASGYSVQEIAVPQGWVGRSLVELELRRDVGIQVIGVRDALTGGLTLPPDPAAKLKPSDSLLIAGRDEVLEGLARAAD